MPSAGENAVPWIEYDNTRKLYLDIDTDLSLHQKLKEKTVNFWKQLTYSYDLKDDFKMSHDEL